MSCGKSPGKPVASVTVRSTGPQFVELQGELRVVPPLGALLTPSTPGMTFPIGVTTVPLGVGNVAEELSNDRCSCMIMMTCLILLRACERAIDVVVPGIVPYVGMLPLAEWNVMSVFVAKVVVLSVPRDQSFHTPPSRRVFATRLKL